MSVAPVEQQARLCALHMTTKTMHEHNPSRAALTRPSLPFEARLPVFGSRGDNRRPRLHPCCCRHCRPRPRFCHQGILAALPPRSHGAAAAVALVAAAAGAAAAAVALIVIHHHHLAFELALRGGRRRAAAVAAGSLGVLEGALLQLRCSLQPPWPAAICTLMGRALRLLLRLLLCLLLLSLCKFRPPGTDPCALGPRKREPEKQTVRRQQLRSRASGAGGPCCLGLMEGRLDGRGNSQSGCLPGTALQQGWRKWGNCCALLVPTLPPAVTRILRPGWPSPLAAAAAHPGARTGLPGPERGSATGACSPAAGWGGTQLFSPLAIHPAY